MYCSIDWLAFTLKTLDRLPLVGVEARDGAVPANAHVMIGTALIKLPGDWHRIRPRHGYANRWRHASGYEIWYNDVVEPQGVHVSIPGSVCSEIEPTRLIDIMEFAHKNGQVARIDLAIDTHERVDIRGMFDGIRNGDITVRQRTYQMVEGSAGETLYLGSRTSQTFIRLYDKAAQTGEGGPWYRLELEAKGQRADGITKYLCSSENPVSEIPSIVRSWFSIEKFGGAHFFQGMPYWLDRKLAAAIRAHG